MENVKMKIKFITKLISAVCAAAMATSAAAIPVSAGQDPANALGENPANAAGNQGFLQQYYNEAKELQTRAQQLDDDNYGALADYNALASDIDTFFNGLPDLVFDGVDIERRNAINEGFASALFRLVSDNYGDLRDGVGMAVDYLSDIVELIEEHMN
jgi:hypothetical protein